MAGTVMTGMTLEKSGKNLIRPDFPDPHRIPAGKALYSSYFSPFPGQKFCRVVFDISHWLVRVCVVPRQAHKKCDSETEGPRRERWWMEAAVRNALIHLLFRV